MKLAIATGILAQALPTLSQKNAELLSPESRGSLAKIISSNDKDSHVSLVKGKNRRRAVLKTLPSTRRGLLTNQERRVNKQATTKYCNPVSEDPDVGILSCGPGMFCQPNKDSLLGGRCEFNEGHNMGLRKGGNVYGKDGLLKNINSKAGSFNGVAPTVECDPSTAADTGILSCGDGEHCVASSLSVLGGYCMQSSESRQLNHLSTEVAICDPSSGLSERYNCDCSGFDNITGTGDVPCTVFEDYCLGLLYAGCGAACVSRVVTYSFVNFTAPVFGYCVSFKTPYEQRVCVEETLATKTCFITVNDQPCNSCSMETGGNLTSVSFDCTNVGGITGSTAESLTQLIPILNSCYTPTAAGDCTLCAADSTVLDPNSYSAQVSVPNLGNFSCYNLYYAAYAFVSINEDYCPAVSAAAAGACCTAICELCGTGDYIPTEKYNTPLNIPLTGYESATCGDLYMAAYSNFSITTDLCPSAASVAQSTCCAPYSQENCDICNGEALVNPDAIVTIYGYDLPCDSLKTLLNETECAVAQPKFAATCCGTANDGTASTSAPGPSNTSSSSTFAVAKNIVSMIGVATIALILAAK